MGCIQVTKVVNVGNMWPGTVEEVPKLNIVTVPFLGGNRFQALLDTTILDRSRSRIIQVGGTRENWEGCQGHSMCLCACGFVLLNAEAHSLGTTALGRYWFSLLALLQSGGAVAPLLTDLWSEGFGSSFASVHYCNVSHPFTVLCSGD